MGCCYYGWCGDVVIIWFVGDVFVECCKFFDIMFGVFELVIELMEWKLIWGGVVKEMEVFVKDFGFLVVEEFVGYVIGKEMYESF